MALGGITPKQKLALAASPLLLERVKNGDYLGCVNLTVILARDKAGSLHPLEMFATLEQASQRPEELRYHP
jgi:hypothetical protein